MTSHPSLTYAVVGHEIVSAILADMDGRSGFDAFFDEMDGYVFKDMVDDWHHIVCEILENFSEV